jgi:hypothetical protein
MAMHKKCVQWWKRIFIVTWLMSLEPFPQVKNMKLGVMATEGDELQDYLKYRKLNSTNADYYLYPYAGNNITT